MKPGAIDELHRFREEALSETGFDHHVFCEHLRDANGNRNGWWNRRLYHSSPSFEGVLQLSAARKGTGAVDDSDLLEFAEDDMEEAGLPEGVTLPHFRGITLATQGQELFFRKWWLANGKLLVFATYTSQFPLRLSELDQVQELLATLRPRSAEP